MRRNRTFALVISFAALLAFLPVPSASGLQKKDWYAKAVKKIEGKFKPAEAKPGQTVTFKLTVELNEGYHTYPTMQPDKGAENFVNELKFPKPGNLIFVGLVSDPKNFEAKEEPVLMVKELRTLSGKATYSRKAVVSPKAKAGEADVKLDSFRLMVCDENTCYPSKLVPVVVKFKVLDGPAVPVEKEYADEVAKAVK